MAHKDYQVPFLQDIVKSDKLNVPATAYSTRFFYNPSEESKGIIINFYGSSTTHTLFNDDDIVPVTILGRGYSFLQVIPVPVISVPLNTSLYVYNTSNQGVIYAHEVQACLNFAVENIQNDAELSGVVSRNTSIFFTGTSRGAGAVLDWSHYHDKSVFKYGDKLKTFYVNAPIGGGSGEGNWYDAQNIARGELELLNNVRHRGIVTYAKMDKTHSNRSIIEKVVFFMENDLVQIVIPEDIRFTHTYPQNFPDLFYNAAIDYFEDYKEL